MLLINEEYYKTFFESIKNAKTCILGFVYHDSIYFSVAGTKTDDLVFALREAKNRGVIVKILCQSYKQVEGFRPFVSEIKIAKGFKTMHSKAFCFDNAFLIAGSHNFTDNAMSINLEMSLTTQNMEEIDKFVRYFESIWQR